jgi:hypothetical protein
MQGPLTQRTDYPEVGLVVIRTPEPVPYYALFSATAGYDWVLSLYDGQRYELECKYTTWIDLESRPTLPRLPLPPLASHLNTLEKNTYRWAADQLTDTGPLLRITGRPLTKAERYADPDGRPIYASSLASSLVEAQIIAYLREGYAGIEPKRYWTWAEVRAASEGVVS